MDRVGLVSAVVDTVTISVNATGPHSGFTCDCCEKMVLLVDLEHLIGACWTCGDWEFVTRTGGEYAFRPILRKPQ